MRTLAKHRAAAVALALACAVAPSSALDFPEHIDGISLKPDAMWQELPDQVRAVFVGPDDRTWIELDHPAQAEDMEKVRSIVRREFASAMPQLFGCRPILFEPGGKVWFTTQSRSVLLGYDGTNMVERKMPDGHYLPGNCPNHGRWYRVGNNLFVSGAAFFIESHGVLRFQDGTWDYRRMTDVTGDRRPQRSPELLAEPDGTGVVAFLSGEAVQPRMDRYREGRWAAIDASAFGISNVVSVAPRNDGIWLFRNLPSKRMIFLPYDTSGVSALFPELLRQLGAKTFSERQAATARLKALGIPVAPLARRALAATDDPEVLERLKEVITAVSPETGSLSSFGPYSLQDAAMEFYDPLGSMYVSATRIECEGRALGPGLVRQNASGAFTCVASADFAACWRTVYSEDSGPLVVPARDWVWRASTERENRAQLLDLAEQTAIRDVPFKAFRWLHAVLRNGSVFVSQREPTQGARPVALFNPSAADTSKRLSGDTVALLGIEPAMTGDGVLFAFLRDQRLARFAGDSWKPVQGVSPCAAPNGASAGRSGILLHGEKTAAFLVDRDGNVTRAKSIEDLFANNREFVARTLGPATRDVATDSNSNVWYRTAAGRTKVLIGDTWVWTDEVLRSSGSRTGEARYMGAPLGGYAVYVTDLMMVHSGGKSFFGCVSEGKPVFVPAPHTCEDREVRMDIHDAEGALWIPGSIRGGSGTCDWISGQLAHRIRPDGSTAVYTNVGWAVLCDAGANVWLGNIRGQRENRFNIWRNGVVTQSVTIPGATSCSGLSSDRPGSVFAWTGTVLRHLASSGPEKTDFSVRAAYVLDGIDGDVVSVRCSPLGFIAVHWRKERPPQAHITVIPAPRGENQGEQPTPPAEPAR